MHEARLEEAAGGSDDVYEKCIKVNNRGAGRGRRGVHWTLSMIGIIGNSPRTFLALPGGGSNFSKQWDQLLSLVI